MPSVRNVRPPKRPDLNVFYVIDTSGSMRGNKIGVLNNAMENSVSAIKQAAAYNCNASVRIAVLEYNSRFRWVQPKGPEYINDFYWSDLTAEGWTNIGAALFELESKLHRGQFISSTSGSFLPVIIFMTDGLATDDYHAGLNELMRNNLFQKATRIGFAIGKDADVKMIEELTGDSRAVMYTDDMQRFAEFLVAVSKSSISYASKSRATTKEENLGADVMRDAQIRMGYDPSQFVYGQEVNETENSREADSVFVSDPWFDNDNF